MNIRYLPGAAPKPPWPRRGQGFLLSSPGVLTLLLFLPRPGADAALGNGNEAASTLVSSSSASPCVPAAASSISSARHHPRHLVCGELGIFAQPATAAPSAPTLRRGASALPSSSFPGAASSASTEASTCSTPFGGRLPAGNVPWEPSWQASRGAVCRLQPEAMACRFRQGQRRRQWTLGMSGPFSPAAGTGRAWERPWQAYRVFPQGSPRLPGLAVGPPPELPLRWFRSALLVLPALRRPCPCALGRSHRLALSRLRLAAFRAGWAFCSQCLPPRALGAAAVSAFSVVLPSAVGTSGSFGG